ncbi:MAG: tail fiber domain-containing protein, partial [bacterium]|nr:tail fiber domain-containing protein [bacterium]
MTPNKHTLLALLERAHQMGDHPEVVERLRWFVDFAGHQTVSKTCNEFGIARTTFYRWYNRLDLNDLSTLENAPKSALFSNDKRKDHHCMLCGLRSMLSVWRGHFSKKPGVVLALVAAIINISIFFLIALPQVAGAASSWAPTLIVNTEAFQTIDDTDSAADLYLQFGGSLNKRLTYDRTLASFIFDDDLEVIGTISGATIHAQDHLSTSGSLAVESGLYGAGLSDCDTGSTDKLLWNADDGTFSCGTDQSGGGGFSGTGSLQNFFDNRYVETGGDTMTGGLLIDVGGVAANTIDSNLALEVVGTASGEHLHFGRFLTGSGYAVIENLTTNAALFLNQDGEGIALDIDSEATTSDIINISAATLTTGKVIDIGDANALTTGTGLIFTGISNSSNTGKRSLFHLENDHANADSTTVMHLQQDGAATTFLADTDGNGIAVDVDSEATSEPGLRISMPTPNASENPHILFGYKNIFDTNLFRDTYNSLTTSGSLAIDPPGLNGAYNFDSVSYADNLAEARTTGGTAFTIFTAENPSNDLFYIGMDDPFFTVYFDLAVAGAGITFEVEYWNGSAWTVTGYRDTTSNLTQDGAVTFVNPENWAVTSVNSEVTNKYWVRLNPAGDNITTAPTAYSVSPTTDYRFKVFSNAADAQPAIFVSNDQKVGIKTNTPETELEVVGTISGSTLHSTDLLSGSGYAVFRNLIDSTTAFQINDANGGNPVFNVNTINERIGIGTDVPATSLHIEAGTLTVDNATAGQTTHIQLRDDSSNNAGFLHMGGDNTDGAFINAGGTPDKLSIKANGITKMTVGTTGINIGTGTPNDALDVEGDIDVTGCFQTDDTTTVGGTCLSDVRLKENIVPLEGMLGKVELLNPVQFDWKAGAPEHGTSVGLIAQELEQVFPHLVSDQEDGFKKIRFGIEMQMVVIAALKELVTNVRNSEIDILSFGSSLGETMGLFASRLTNLEKRVEDIENHLPELGENGNLQTISDGQISIGGTFYLIDTENSDDTDVLAKIDGGTVNQILVLQGFDEEHEITVRKTKSLVLKEDYKIRGPDDVLVLLKVTDTKWIELSRT